MCSIVTFYEVCFYFIVNFLTMFLIVVATLCLCVASIVCFFLNLLAKFFIVYFIAIFALNICTKFFCKFFLNFAHWFNSIVCSFQSINKILLRHFVHFAFYHHNIIFGSTNHYVHISFFHLFEGWIYDIFSINSCNTNFRDRIFDRYI